MTTKTLNITQSELVNVPVVPFTSTWAPVHHNDVAGAMDLVLGQHGIQVRAKSFEISANGMDLFAQWDLEITGGAHKGRISIGFRNSMQKSFALGLCAGLMILVCSNLCFSGDFVEHRKHTIGLADYNVLYQFLMGAVLEVLKHANRHQDWFQGLHAFPLYKERRKALVYDMMAQGVLAPSKFNQLEAAYAEELKVNRQGDTENYAHLHGAATRVLRGYSIDNLQRRSGILNRIIAADTIPMDLTEDGLYAAAEQYEAESLAMAVG